MTIVGCDFHPSWQQIAILDMESGEVRECKLVNGNGEAERFYRQLPAPSLIGVEACGNSQWFVDMLQGLGHEVWIGDAAQIRASYVRKQKTDRRDAGHILKLLMEGRFPRLWTPSAEQRNLRQLLIHRPPYFYFCSAFISFHLRPKGFSFRRRKAIQFDLRRQAGDIVLGKPASQVDQLVVAARAVSFLEVVERGIVVAAI
jgi:hypothetical protein